MLQILFNCVSLSLSLSTSLFLFPIRSLSHDVFSLPLLILSFHSQFPFSVFRLFLFISFAHSIPLSLSLKLSFSSLYISHFFFLTLFLPIYFSLSLSLCSCFSHFLSNSRSPLNVFLSLSLTSFKTFVLLVFILYALANKHEFLAFRHKS